MTFPSIMRRSLIINCEGGLFVHGASRGTQGTFSCRRT